MVDFFISVLFTFGFNASDDTWLHYTCAGLASHFSYCFDLSTRPVENCAGRRVYDRIFLPISSNTGETVYHYDVGLPMSIFRYVLFGLVLWAIINGLFRVVQY